MSVTGEPGDGRPPAEGRRGAHRHGLRALRDHRHARRPARPRAQRRGQRVEVSLMDSVLAGLLNQGSAYLRRRASSPGRMGNRHPSIAPYETFAPPTARSPSRSATTRSSRGSARRSAARAGGRRALRHERARAWSTATSWRAALEAALAGGAGRRLGGAAGRRPACPPGPINDVAAAFALAERLGLDPSSRPTACAPRARRCTSPPRRPPCAAARRASGEHDAELRAWLAEAERSGPPRHLTARRRAALTLSRPIVRARLERPSCDELSRRRASARAPRQAGDASPLHVARPQRTLTVGARTPSGAPPPARTAALAADAQPSPAPARTLLPGRPRPATAAARQGAAGRRAATSFVPATATCRRRRAQPSPLATGRRRPANRRRPVAATVVLAPAAMRWRHRDAAAGAGLRHERQQRAALAAVGRRTPARTEGATIQCRSPPRRSKTLEPLGLADDRAARSPGATASAAVDVDGPDLKRVSRHGPARAGVRSGTSPPVTPLAGTTPAMAPYRRRIAAPVLRSEGQMSAER